MLRSSRRCLPTGLSARFLMSKAVPSPHFVQGKDFKLALVQLATTDEVSVNLHRAREKVLQASRQGKANVVVLPECFNSPYGVQHFSKYAQVIGAPRDLSSSAPWDPSSSPSESIRALSTLAKEANIWLIGGSIPERVDADGASSHATGETLYNTCTIYNPKGQCVGLHRKIHLFDIDVPNGITFKESDSLSPGQSHTMVETDYGTIGIGVCYDIRFPELTMIAARQGAIAMIFPSAFNLTTGPMHWALLQRARAVDNQIYVSMCSPARDERPDPQQGEKRYRAWGESMVVDPMGKIVVQTDEKESIIYADISIETINKARQAIPTSAQRRFDLYPDVAAHKVETKGT